MTNKYLLLTTCLLALFSVQTVAQEVVQLDSIQVTASRISTTISESGKNVSVITRQDIEQMPVTSVDELVRSLPGVNINSRQGFGVQSDIGIRGSTYSQVLFMLDNVPLNDPLTAHFNTNIPVSLLEIGQIELIRGPASASYGADAVGGVVHIKTRTYLEREVSRTDRTISQASGDLGAGQNGLTTGDLAVELQQNRWRASASLRSVRSDGERLRNPGFDAGVSDEAFYHNYFEMLSGSGSISYRAGENWNWYLRGGYDERDFSARYFYTRSETDEATEQIRNRWILSALTRDSGDHRTELNASFRRVEDNFDFNSRLGVPVNEHTTDLFFLNLSHRVSTGNLGSDRIASSRLMAGAQLNHQQIESTDRGDHSDLMGGFYLIGNAAFTNGLNLTASSRLQYETRGSAEFLPQLSASYQAGDVTFRGSAGRAIRLADYTERYISTQIDNLGPGRNIGNPDLAPERSYTFDLGLDWQASATTRISPTLFYRTSDNLIDYTLTNSNQIGNADNLQPDELYFYTRNVENTRTAGAELLGSHQVQLATNRSLRIDGGYTYIHTSNDAEEVSKYIANHPVHQVSLGLRLQTTRFSVTSQSGYYVRDEEAAEIIDAEVPESYFLTNLNLSFTPQRLGATFYTQILNLTDTQYQEILGAPMPGRWVMGGVRVRLR